MKIDLTAINKDEFNIIPQRGNEITFLVIPKIGAKWTKDNLIFRSSIWNDNGELISAGYKKFFNWNEQPNIDQIPYNISDCQLIEKIDGSCLIVSFYKGNLIIRTRGSHDTLSLENCYEIKYFREKYPLAFDFKYMETCPFSYIFEWVTPKNRIVLNYTEPELYLTGIINHHDYSYYDQKFLDKMAIELNVKRPKTYNFNSLDDMINSIRDLKGVEGICVYYNKGQSIRKVKSAEYLMLHRLKFDLDIENLLDLYLKFDRPNYNEFIKNIVETFDYEILDFIRNDISKICDAAKEVNKIIDHMKQFVLSCKGLTRKDAAKKILDAYSNTSRSNYVFNLYDGKDISNDGMKKLYLQIISKGK